MTQKPIKATLDSSDDSVKTQKPILIQLDDIPTPEVEDAGKVLGVDDEGKYALTEGGGGKLYLHHLQSLGSGMVFGRYIDIITKSSTALTASDVAKILFDLGLDSASRVWMTNAIYPQPADGTLNITTGFYSANGTVLRCAEINCTPTITDNQITYTNSSATGVISILTDRILEI